jgi:OOP family OmpA-OmpF porin
MSNFKSLLLISVSAAIIFGALPVFADANNTYINGSLGRQFFDSDRLLKNEQLISIGLEHRYSNGWGAEIFWMDSSPSGRNNAAGSDLTQYGIDGLYYFNSDENNKQGSANQPYGVLGLGYADFKNSVRFDKGAQLRAGLGLRVTLNEHWSVKGDLRLIYSNEASAIDNTFTVGLSYALNKQNKKVLPVPSDNDNDGLIDDYDSCPNTSVGVEVDSTGCALDTDGDGVPNYADNCPATPAARAVDVNGCKFALISKVEVTLKVNFARNSNVIMEEHNPEIEKVANFLKKHPEVTTVIEGHTSSRGADDYNIELSKARAEAIKTVLIERFVIDAGRISTLGYGEARPIATNDTEAGRLANRRVVAVIETEVSE